MLRLPCPRLVVVAAVVLAGYLPCAWQQEDATPALPAFETTHDCTEQHPKYADQRVCLFSNLLLFKNTVYYVSSTVAEFSPIYISWERRWEGFQLLHIQTLLPSALPTLLANAELEQVPVGGLFHQQHPTNFYHLFTEVAPTIHYTLCKHLGLCRHRTGPAAGELRLFWANRKDAAISPETFGYRAPPSIAELMTCFTPLPVLNILEATQPAKAGGRPRAWLLRRAVAGLPRAARLYHQKKSELQERHSDPPPAEFMASYRRRVADCLGINFVDAVAPTYPVRITVVNRHYEAGRCILNAQAIKERIQQMPALQKLAPGGYEVNIIYIGGTLREQAALAANTSIYIWGHGAAMAHTFFLPQGAQALELVQWVVRDPGDQHVWVQGIQRAFNLDIGLGALVNDDRTKVFFNYDVIMAPESQYWRFNDTEKRMLWEELKCPTWQVDERSIDGFTCFGWFHWGMSVVWKFELLGPRVEAAMEQLLARVEQLLRQPALMAEGAPAAQVAHRGAQRAATMVGGTTGAAAGAGSHPEAQRPGQFAS